MAGINIIRRWVMSQMTKKSDDGIMITLPDMKKVELNTNITIEKFLQNGINPDAFTNTQQVDNVINQLNKPKVISQDDPLFKGVMSRMMGKNVIKKDFGPGFKKEVEKMKGKVDDDLPPPGSRGGKDDIAAPVQSAEETLKDMIQAENKKNITAMKKRKMLDDAIEDASPGFANDIKYDAEIVAENLAERMGLVYDDLPTKERLDLYDQAYSGLSKKRFKNKPEPEDKADGGRIGLKDGISLESILEGKIPTVKMPDPLQKILEKMTPEEKEMFKMRMEIMRRGFEINNPANPDAVKPVPMPTYPKENRADGGRIGYKKGSVDLARRGFMKAAAGVGAGIGALKMGALKLFGKEGTRQVTKNIIKTDNVPGKPEWFDALVTKVINQGEDVTKRFATKEREIVHMKKLDKDTTVKVTQDLDDGAIRVEYDSPDNVYGDPVQLQYKKSLPDEGDPNPSAEFDVAESGPVGRSFGPDDYEIEIDEVGGTSIKDLTSDVSKLKEYAVGKKPTLKEFVQSKKRKDRAKAISEGGENEMDEVVRRQGEFIQFEDIDPNMASGGLARLKYQMGGDVAYDATNQDIYGSSAITVTPDTMMDQFGNQVQAEKGNNFNKPLIPQVTEQVSKQEGIMNSSPVVSQSGGTGEIDMPIAGGNKNEMGILPVMPTDMRYEDPGSGVGGTGEKKLEAVQYNDPLPTNQLMSGFEEYKKTNPPGSGTMALVPVTLPNGEQFTFRNGAEAAAFARYLQSIGQAPYQRRQDPGMLAKFATGGIARMLGE